MTAITQEALRAEIAEILELEPAAVEDDAILTDIGLDSMRAMNLAALWEENGMPLDFGDLGEADTLGELWALVEARQGKSAN